MVRRPSLQCVAITRRSSVRPIVLTTAVSVTYDGKHGAHYSVSRSRRRFQGPHPPQNSTHWLFRLVSGLEDGVLGLPAANTQQPACQPCQLSPFFFFFFFFLFFFSRPPLLSGLFGRSLRHYRCRSHSTYKKGTYTLYYRSWHAPCSGGSRSVLFRVGRPGCEGHQNPSGIESGRA